MRGLTQKQEWTHEHISRCPTCGAWEVITETERAFRELGIHAVPPFCKHFTNHESEQVA